MKTIGISGCNEEVKKHKYAYAFIGTDMTNSISIEVGVDVFDDFDELKVERGMDEEEIEEIKNMEAGESIWNENYWTIVRIK